MSFRARFKALLVNQPLGEYYVASIPYKTLLDISWVYRREMKDELDQYMGIQRSLDDRRVEAISRYSRNLDACFPTSITMAVSSDSFSWHEDTNEIELSEASDGKVKEIGLILDGQHRLEGLRKSQLDHPFELATAIFVGTDIGTQASIFATVNLAQTKVNRSLVYDLLAVERVRSPLKSCHEITVALDTLESSPFFRRVKRLGVRTKGREAGEEVLTQAAFVESLVKFISRDPYEDRNTFMRKLVPKHPDVKELSDVPFRSMWIKKEEKSIAKVLINYFAAVKGRWPSSWENTTRKGNVLPKTNGFKALMRYLKPVYLDFAAKYDFHVVPTVEQFAPYFESVELEDKDFNTEVFKPGTSGEARLFNLLSNDKRSPGFRF